MLTDINKDKILQIVSKLSGIDIDELRPEHTLRDDLYMASEDSQALIEKIEHELTIMIDIDDFDDIITNDLATIQDVFNLIEQYSN